MPGRFRKWLGQAPVSDPVDRRNAPMFQLVMLILASVPPPMWAYRAWFAGVPWREGELLALTGSLAVSGSAACALVLVRLGRFQLAVRQMLVVVAASMFLAYASGGFASQRYELPIQVMWLFVAGAVVGRRALWAMFAALCLSFAAGAILDFRADPSHYNGFVDALISTVMFFLIATVIDRSTNALRDSLAAATARSEALAIANTRLAEEIAARERTQEQLLHAQRVEAVGKMASGIAHDFNHLLSLVLGYAARGRAPGADAAVIEEALHGIESAARRGKAVSNKLVSFSRQDASRPERFDAGNATREMASMLRQALGAGIRLVLEVPERPLPVHLDRAQFELVLLNIATNAAHAMPEGGTALLSLDAHDGQLTLAFKDSGHGMAADIAARALQPFFTTKPAEQGTGLGLSVSADVLAEAGGRLRLDSSPGAGTTVHLQLPLADVLPGTPHQVSA